MPRPSKRVSPDTLGGKIRFARQNLHLSLSDVAGERYSTSLISQIERNRVDPSLESLHYLAERLQLPFEDLQALAEQHRESEIETHTYKVYEDQRVQVSQFLERNQARAALERLQNMDISKVPLSLRWRMFALRGECYFSLRKFLAAQRDFLSAVAVLPEKVPTDLSLEEIILRLHLAAATRELGQLDDALEQYSVVLKRMNTSIPLRYVAEAHWGMALVIFEQVESDTICPKEVLQREALSHAETASHLYRSTEEILRASLLDCQIALIQQSTGDLDGARNRLRQVLDYWLPTLSESFESQYTLKERANVVSAAACYLAGVELEVHNCSAALDYVQQALEAGKQSYILRRAEAYMMYGQILDACDKAGAEEAFKNAVKELNATDRLAARIRAHDLLGRYLMRKGNMDEGVKELDTVRRLSNILTPFTTATTSAEDINAK